MKPNFRNLLLGCLLALSGLVAGPALAHCTCLPAPQSPGLLAQPAYLAPTQATPQLSPQKMAPARPKLSLAQRLLAKWAARKAGKQLRGGRPIHWANIASPLAVLLGQIVISAGLRLGTWLALPAFGLLMILAGLGLGIFGIIKSGKNKEYSGQGLGIAGVAYSGLWLLGAALLVAVLVLGSW